MKWYSIKQYRAPADGYCLIRTEHGSFYCAEWRGGSNDEDADSSCGWMMNTLSEGHGGPSYIEIFGVTHFCIPDPIPKSVEESAEDDWKDYIKELQKIRHG